jgi:hypothetical protein
VRKILTFCGEVAGVLAIGLSVPVAILLIGMPVALVIRLALEAWERL